MSPRPARTFLLLVLGALLLGASPIPRPAGSSPLHGSAAPQKITLQPDAANGTDAWIGSLSPLWNFGNDSALWVGPDMTNGGLARSLLSFDLSRLPANASIQDASMQLYETSGSGGSVQVRPVTASWVEGLGGHSWTVVPIIVRETAGMNRTLELIGVTVSFSPGSIRDPARDLRVYAGAAEVPSQVYDYGFSAGQIASARVFFGTTIGAYGTEVFNIVYSTNGTGVPPYRTKAWGTSSAWSFGPTGGGASGATIADLDGDGRLDVIFGGTDGYVYVLNDQGQLKWRTRVSTTQSVPFTPQVADVDRSGRKSVVVVTNDPAIVRLNSAGSVVWAYNSSSLLYTTPTLFDVDGDGILDVLVGGNMKQVQAISGLNGTLVRNYPLAVAGYTAAIADVNRDGAGEIIVPGDDKVVHVYRADATQLWAAAAPGGSFLEGSISVGDVNGDGALDIVTGDDTNNGMTYALRASDGAMVWSAPLPSYREGGQTLADLDGDGNLEVYTGLFSGVFYALRGTSGATMWTYNGGTTQPGSPSIVDLTKDTIPDIVFIEGTVVYALDRNGALLHSWTIPLNNQNLRAIAQHPMTSPAIADVDGDGTLDVIAPTGSGMQAFSTGGLARDWRTWGYNLNHTNRAFDGNSLEGVPFLQATVGAPQVHPAEGVSWNYRDGTQAWSLAGGDFGPPVASAAGTIGWMTWNVTDLVRAWHSGQTANDGFALTEAAEITGILHAFQSSDATSVAQRPRLTVAYDFPAAASPPTIVGRIPDLVQAENSPPFSIDLKAYASDPDTPSDQLRWNVTGYNASVVQIAGLNTPGNHILTFYPQPNAWGSVPLIYWLTDPNGGFDSQTAWLNLTYANQPPTFDPPAIFFVHYNRTYSFDFDPYVRDVDTPKSQLTLSTNDPAHTSVSGFAVSFLYPQALLGQWQFVNLTVSDGEYAVMRTVAVQVTSDDPPVLRQDLPDVTLLEGEFRAGVFNLNNYFTDPNNDALFYSSGYSHLTITIQADRSVDFQAQAGWWGEEIVTFRATDPTGALAEDMINVTVLHVDLPPAFGPVPDLRVRHDTPYSFNLEPYLIDSDTPSERLAVNASDAHVFVSGHLLTVLYPSSFNGTTQDVTLSLSDGIYTVNHTIRVTIGDDWPPVRANKMADVSFPEDTALAKAYNLTAFFSDPDGPELFWSSGNRSVLVTIHANGSTDLSALPNWAGTERVTFRATDPIGALQEDSVWITVTPVDDPPSIRAIPDLVLNVTTAYLPLGAYVDDPDNDVSQLFLVGTNSSHAQPIGMGLLFNYTSDTTEYVQIVVSDGTLTASATIRVRVALPGAIVTTAIPGFLYWLPIPTALLAFVSFLLYRHRQLEWAFLVTNSGILVASVARRSETTLDTDLLTGMLTAIMDFAKQSFSDEKERHLEGLSLGEKRVAIVRGNRSYLAVVYRGRTPGRLLRIMRSLLTSIERRYPQLLGDVVETSKAGEVIRLLQRLVTRGSLPFVSFEESTAARA